MANKTDDKTKGCAFQWEIANISHCWLENGQRIDSPTFIADGVDGTKWSLRLYPMGYASKNKLDFFLHREKDCSGPNHLSVNYQLAFLDKHGSFLKETTIVSKEYFQKGTSWVFQECETPENIFVTEKEAFLPNATLTVQFTIWGKGNKPTEPTHLHALTVFEVNRKCFVCRINKFSILKSKVLYRFKGNFIEFDLHLNEGLDFQKNLAIQVNTTNQDIKYFSFKICIVDSEGKKGNCGAQEYFADDLKRGVSNTLLFPKEWMENKSQYLPNDVLSLDCEYVYSNGAVSSELCCSAVISPNLTNEVAECKNEKNIRKEETLKLVELVKDLTVMYNDAIFSNTTLRTSTQTFPAHKDILSARSPVFRSMFSSEMKEKHSGNVDIRDFEDDTIRRMLLYIYTDSLEDLQFETASKLYAAADKYQILSLRNRCSSFFKDNLCPINACDVLVLADLHNDEDLKVAVEDYIQGQRKQIFCSQEWRDFMHTHLKLAADVMYKSCQE